MKTIPKPQGTLKATDLKENQIESKYDTHSEKKPHQKTTVSTDANPDRVSNDNRDTTSSKIDKDDAEVSGQDDENLSEPFPKSRSSSFPSLL
ncbi:hypothetical protein [Flavobacterium sp. N1994]|uniref:hypothetical protein n=1 Tax=Flavobacterium sp. N1994 TaxID=2986827 RepID=UPI0022214A6F|nr:hypothetical protein [Flavobacterium sp. N1994]